MALDGAPSHFCREYCPGDLQREHGYCSFLRQSSTPIRLIPKATQQQRVSTPERHRHHPTGQSDPTGRQQSQVAAALHHRTRKHPASVNLATERAGNSTYSQQGPNDKIRAYRARRPKLISRVPKILNHNQSQSFDRRKQNSYCMHA